MKAIKYKLYSTQEDGTILKEFFTKKEIEKFRTEEDQTLFECAENMIFQFNAYIRDGEQKRYAYKLEKVTIEVLGSQEYYGLNIGSEMCEPEF